MSSTLLDLKANKPDEVAKISWQNGHLEAFGNTPVEDVHVLFLFGVANDQMVHPEEEDYRAIQIHYFESRARERINANPDEELGLLNTDVVASLIELYSDEGDDDKAISVHSGTSVPATASVDPKVMSILLR